MNLEQNRTRKRAGAVALFPSRMAIIIDPDLNSVLRIYYPDYARSIGKSSRINKSEVKRFINKILSFKDVLGFIDGAVLPALIFEGEDKDTNTIRISSPYIMAVIHRLLIKQNME